MEWIKESIRTLKGYHPSSLPYRVKLDANEGKNSIFKDLCFEKDMEINLYPDSDAKKLREEIGRYIGVKASKIIAGNGSSEMIDLIMKTFVEKGETILSFVPTFSMYEIYSQIYSAQFLGVKSKKDFSLDMEEFIEKMDQVNPKVVLLCNPNNPTGYQISPGEIKRLLEKTKALVVVDEAYMEFSEGSVIDEIDTYPNLIVLRTLSKAFGLAGIRLGYMVANEEMMEVLNRVKAPYNLNALTQYVGIQVLQRKEKIQDYIKEAKKEREKLYRTLKTLEFQVYPSGGNFLFFKSDIENFHKKLVERGILIRSFSEDLEGYYRVSIGSQEENENFIRGVKEIVRDEKGAD